MKQYNLAISSVGSGVAQGVMNALKLADLPVKTFGFGYSPFAFGAYDCDETDFLPSYYDASYPQALLDLCLKHKIDLLIPTMDDELLAIVPYLDRFKENEIKVLCSSPEFIRLCRNKHKLIKQLGGKSSVFVDSFTREEALLAVENGDLSLPLIAKPTAGFASIGVKIIRSKDDITPLEDDYLVETIAYPQKKDPHYEAYMAAIAKGENLEVAEFSVQLLFSSKSELLGKMALYSQLRRGVPVELIPFDCHKLWSDLSPLIIELQNMGVKGPVNIDGRLTDEGFKGFEINPRYTGNTGIRALMGFNEVAVAIADFLGLPINSELKVDYRKIGLRQVMDRVVEVDSNSFLKQEVEAMRGV